MFGPIKGHTLLTWGHVSDLMLEGDERRGNAKRVWEAGRKPGCAEIFILSLLSHSTGRKMRTYACRLIKATAHLRYTNWQRHLRLVPLTPITVSGVSLLQIAAFSC
jgi:hypothetical protein